MVTITFACGHPPLTWSDGDGYPRCPVCGVTQIARVVAPPPRITGAVVLPRVQETSP